MVKRKSQLSSKQRVQVRFLVELLVRTQVERCVDNKFLHGHWALLPAAIGACKPIPSQCLARNPFRLCYV